MAKILLIDDEESIRFTCERFLKAEGHTVVTAKDSREATEKMDEAHFDLILADIILEDGSGIDLLKGRRERWRTSPVIVITGCPSLESALEAIRLGVVDYIPKPVTQEVLLRAVRAALGARTSFDEREEYFSNIEAVLKNIENPMIMLDQNLKIIELNDAAINICGLARSVIGKPFPTLSGTCDKRCIEAVMETIETIRPVELPDVRCGRAKESPGFVSTISTYPLIDRNGRSKGAVMTVKTHTGVRRDSGQAESA